MTHTSYPDRASSVAPWQNKEVNVAVRFGLTVLGILLLMVLMVSGLVAIGVIVSFALGNTQPAQVQSNLVVGSVAALVCFGSLAGLFTIWPYTRAPNRFTPSYGAVDPTTRGHVFEVRFQRYLWGRSMRGKGTMQFAPEGLIIAGNLEPHTLFQIGVVLVVTILPLVFFNFGLGIIPALLIAYYVGRKKFSRTIPYPSIQQPEVKGRQLTLRCDEAPRQIDVVVASVDGERLYRELLPHFPTILGGWQG